MRFVLISLVAFIFANGAFAQSQPLAIALGAKVADSPQVTLHVYPSERFELALSAYTNDEIGGIADNFIGSVSALTRFRADDPLSLRLGANYTWSERARIQSKQAAEGEALFAPWRWAGPVVGFDYALNDRFTAFADLTVGVDLDIYSISMANTGIGMVYRLKRP